MEQANAPVAEVLPEDCSGDHFWEKKQLWKPGFSSHWFEFSMLPEVHVHSAIQGLLVKKIFIQMFHMYTHPPICMHTCMCPCMHTTTIKGEKKKVLCWEWRRCWILWEHSLSSLKTIALHTKAGSLRSSFTLGWKFSPAQTCMLKHTWLHFQTGLGFFPKLAK